MEFKLDGPIHRAGGVKDQTGKKRGPYLIGGPSDRTLRHTMPTEIDQDVAAEDAQGVECGVEIRGRMD